MPIGLVVGALIFFLVASFSNARTWYDGAARLDPRVYLAFPTILLGVMD